MIAVRCGVDFPYLVFQWASGRPIDAIDGYRVGAWMRYLKGDLMTTIAAVRERGKPGITPPVRTVVDFALSCFRPIWRTTTSTGAIRFPPSEPRPPSRRPQSDHW